MKTPQQIKNEVEKGCGENDICANCNHSREYHNNIPQHSYWCSCSKFIEKKGVSK
jgi:hypothetical protein